MVRKPGIEPFLFVMLLMIYWMLLIFPLYRYLLLITINYIGNPRKVDTSVFAIVFSMWIRWADVFVWPRGTHIQKPTLCCTSSNNNTSFLQLYYSIITWMCSLESPSIAGEREREISRVYVCRVPSSHSMPLTASLLHVSSLLLWVCVWEYCVWSFGWGPHIYLCIYTCVGCHFKVVSSLLAAIVFV